MRNNIQSKIDAGYTYDELLSEGLASFDDIARYESQYSLYDEDAEPKPKKKKVKPKTQGTKPKKEVEIDFEF
ncbi:MULTISPECIES: hypothetical protein [Pseudanabaena]|uniref:Uncharacterized protein n=2 Tax=Pseudanabaena TaxID=1152 RepID=L8MZY1_9CYAN|nr:MULTISPECIES: hypothetical protein [Pseudanabaena]ELS31558.1 hypothetical protein Pse7429DRAFT_3931 [Pseudanabaena biceps PCC 7429]MDG3496190.1 hypothetical protein [Pseudanabaena catenata USMAC16]